MSAHRVSLFKHRSGVYYVLYYENGRRKWKSTSCTTKPEALKALTQFRELLTKRVRSIPLREFFAQFLTYAETTYRPKTLEMYRTLLTRFEALYPKAFLSDLTAEHVDRYKAKRLSEVSPVSVHVELRTLRSILNTARRWKLLSANVFDGVSLPQLPEQAPLALSVEDFQKLLAAIRESWFRDVVLFAVLTGLRRGEILNLKWSNVDLSRKLVQVETSATFKTKAGRRRTIPLSEAAFALLSARFGKSPSEFVFTLNDRPIFEDWVTHLFKRYVRKLSLSNSRIRFHSLRHTFASWLVQSGVPIFQVKALLGHRNVRTTESYSHLSGSNLHEVVNKIPLN
jgi:integrase